ncbi:MAG: heat-inducible transcriptional repressor HrcA [Armatimonadota bacterium]
MVHPEDSLVLSERQMTILEALIEEYINTAQPVSSSAIADHPGIVASSATVRNELARLEEIGLLLQPHTSAGRIPTDLGYRVYVNNLMTQYRSHRFADAQRPQVHDPGVEATVRMLGELTRYTALALVPGWQEQRLQHIELAPVGEDQLLVMLVTENRQVLHSLGTAAERPAPPRLRQLNDLLNKEFAGKPLSELTEDALARAVDKLPHAPSEFYRSTPSLVRRGLEQEPGATRILVEGTSRLFEQQDFAETPKLRALMEALHEESIFEQLFNRTHAGEIQVSIGAENPHPGLQDCAIVFTSFKITEGTTGKVGVLGPKRMQYRQVITAVDTVVNNLDRRLNNPSQEE